jgi:predicted ATPase/DNA-binding XRE family transcriptional regulator/Tfp pilus assembly protein PilF
MKEEIAFGNWLKQGRKRLDLTQLKLADQIGCAISTLQKIENSERQPSREFARRIAEVLNVAPVDLPAFIAFARGSQDLRVCELFLPPTNLPAAPTPLIGREAEVADVCKRLLRQETRLITLLGPPGVGKTRLSLQVASEVRPCFDDGVFFVPLAAITDSDLFAPSIARTLGLKDSGHRAPVDHLCDYLRLKKMLLVLDNFEQIVAASPLVADLLSSCQLLKVLATSRMPLRLRAERQYPVQPLATPELTKLPPLVELTRYPAIALFTDRAEAVRPDFSITKDNASAVAAICQRLDGLPLAIELIATNLRILNLNMLFDSLNNGGLLESGELLDLEPRQRTLRDTLDWSYNLLTPLEQSLLERLAVFSGGWSLEAAMKVCTTAQTGDPTIVETLSSQIPGQLRSLGNKCLITQLEENGLSRFSMLEVIREYLSERFASRESFEVVQEEHARYYLQLAESAVAQFHGVNELQLLMQLEREISNFRLALEWCLSRPHALAIGMRLSAALWWFWSRRGFITEGKAWLMRYIDQFELADPPTSEILFPLAKIYTGMGRLTWGQGDYASARSWIEKGLILHRQVGDTWYHGYSLQTLADVLSDLDETSPAQEIALESLRLALETGDPWLEGLPHSLFGEIARNRGDYCEAQIQYTTSLALMQQAGDERNMAFMLHNLGQVAQRQGDYARARELHVEALKIHQKSRPVRAVAFGLEMLAGVAGACGKHLKAARLLGSAEALRQAAGNPVEGTEMQFYTGIISQARLGLDEQSFTTAWVDGYAMTLEQAVAYALEE